MSRQLFVVRSCNFDWHAAVPCETFSLALAAAKTRGFQATIHCGGVLVASWCPLYGTQIRDYALAQPTVMEAAQ